MAIHPRPGPEGCPLLPGATPNSFNRKLKALTTALSYPEGGGTPPPLPHAFRRGATDEVKISGPTLATIATSGTWLSTCYKNCLGLQADAAINISTHHLDEMGAGSDSDDPDIPPECARNVKRVATRVRRGPMIIRDEDRWGQAESSESDTSTISGG